MLLAPTDKCVDVRIYKDRPDGYRETLIRYLQENKEVLAVTAVQRGMEKEGKKILRVYTSKPDTLMKELYNNYPFGDDNLYETSYTEDDIGNVKNYFPDIACGLEHEIFDL